MGVTFRPRRPRTSPVPSRRRTLKELLDRLPSPDVQRKDLKSLLCQLILDTPDDPSASDRTPRLKAKLEALALLRDLINDEGDQDTTGDLLALLGSPRDPPPGED